MLKGKTCKEQSVLCHSNLPMFGTVFITRMQQHVLHDSSRFRNLVVETTKQHDVDDARRYSLGLNLSFYPSSTYQNQSLHQDRNNVNHPHHHPRAHHHHGPYSSLNTLNGPRPSLTHPNTSLCRQYSHYSRHSDTQWPPPCCSSGCPISPATLLKQLCYRYACVPSPST